MVQNRAAITSSVICGWPDHTLAKAISAMNAADGQAIGSLGVFRVLQRDVGQRHAELRPQADFGPARYRQPISGFALDPGLDLDVRKPEGIPMISSRARTTMTAAVCGAWRFSVLS